MASERDTSLRDALASEERAAAFDVEEERRAWEETSGGPACSLVVRGELVAGIMRVSTQRARALASRWARG